MLRVISGRFKGLRLKEVGKEITRPTTDKNKEMIFNILGQYFDGGLGLDLFAGSGAIGIEAISRGISSCVFVDNSFQAIKVIKENLTKLQINIGEEAFVIKKDVIDYLNHNNTIFDFIFMDPPYDLDLYAKAMNLIEINKLLSKNGIIILESKKEKDIDFISNQLVKIREVISGITKYSFYQWEESL
ncbi:MAG: 16S rRNA (guanine(966)-N(2))-methyltransferase RsmD [Firmicutes bacterium]|nr:16S rRNA (guanine(966)-N(2))-methyltransferase RsmD [Bacillota bacterium]